MIFFKYVVLAYIPLLIATNAHCESISKISESSSDLRLSRIIRASNLESLKSKSLEIKRLENQKEECDIQLRYEMLPSSCFEVIRLEKKMSLLSPKKYQETFVWLTENCIDRASQLKKISRTAAQTGALPDKCLELVHRKIADQFYRDVTMNPVALFKQRF